MNANCIFPFAILILCIYNGVSACNPVWMEYNGICYKFFNSTEVDFRMARKFCQVLKGDLAYINPNMTALLEFSLSNAYWVRENSVATAPLPAVPQSECPYLKMKLINYADCSENHGFICETPNNPAAETCPEGWSLYDSKCYKTIEVSEEFFNESVSPCVSHNGYLAILDNEEKEKSAAAVIIGKDNVFVVGAKRDGEGFKWFNGSPFNPSCSVCTNFASNGSCLGLKSSSSHPTLFQWENVPCESGSSFLCQLDSRENVTVTTTTLTTTMPTTTIYSAPKICPIGYNWKAYRDSEFCFWETTYETERLNWYQARKFCQAYGGDLASYRNSPEEDHGLGGAKGHYKGLWFGLRRGQDDVFRWVDGTELNYTNWDHNEPQYKSRSNYCVTHGAGSARWELDYCGVRRWFICKAPKIQNPTLPGINFPKTTCNSTSGSAYNFQRWFLYDNHCYLVNEEAKYSWGLAHNFCKDNNAHLASIHSFNETDFVIFIGSIVTSSDYWIGLSSVGLGSSFTWSDGTPLDFLYWQNDSSPNATESVNSCVTFDPMRGFWKTAHCNKLSGVICKKGVNSSYEFPTQEPTASLPGNCEQGWYLLGNLCYKVFGRKWTQRLSWSSAQRSCENESATLASVHNQEQQEFLTDLTLESENDAWIGLQNMFRGTLFQWEDDSALDYVNWDVNEPSISNDDEDTDLYYTSSYERSCVEINYGRDNMGKWNDVSCQQNNAYICQKPKDPSITRQPEDPFQCSNITGWHRLGTSCYGIFELKDQKATWTEAQSKCRRYGSDLVSFKNSAVGVFLSKKITKKDVFFWTGIRETEKGKYGVLNGKRMKSSYWLVGQPTSVSIFMDNCVAMNSDAKWVVKSCRESLGFICEFNSEIETEIVEDESHLCPQTSGWIDVGTNMCVKTFFDRKTWNDAMYYCFQHGGSLVTFHSAKELQTFVEYVSSNYHYTSVHIGLGRRKDGSYSWADYSPVDFTAWNLEDPPSSTKDCVELDLRSEKWVKVHCDDTRRYFFCSASKDRGTEEDNTGNSTSENIIGKKLAIGGIFGIVICLLVVVAVIGVTLYYLFPPIQKRELLPPETQL